MLDRYFPASEILQAGDAAEAARAIAAACAQQRPIYPVGGGTCLALGAKVSQPGTILSLSRLSGVIDYPSRDLTITVEAGMTIGQLAEHLSAENQRLPIDVHQAGSATVGGVVAANLSGPRRYRYGTVRDYLLGLSAVDGTGKTFSAGGRVVKNAAGYDLTRLMIGSLGTLGVITQVTFMVRPIPEMSALATIALPALEKADSLLDALAASGIEPAAVELLASSQVPAALAIEAPVSLWIGLEGGTPEVQWMLQAVTELCRNHALKAVVHDAADSVESIWCGLTEHGSIIPADPLDTTLAVEATVLPSKSVALAARLRELLPDVSVHCHAGSGVLLAKVPCEPPQAGPAVAEIRNAALEFGGRAVVTAWPAESRMDQAAVWGPPGSEMRVMQRVKQQFDPQGILNPGRFIFEPACANLPT